MILLVQQRSEETEFENFVSKKERRERQLPTSQSPKKASLKICSLVISGEDSSWKTKLRL